ncbi:hypothetical protein [Endozoicomonas atrinae]|uniref:hypothetical protein n=1 Tax=Endozoicomonas atrinae TaxID=1333660 RepID=UPI0009F4765C|nr:hypothetical protein [Endozoicomonas atrinae]
MSDPIKNKISTSALARSLELPVGDLFRKMEQAGWIERINDGWVLTSKGLEEGGEYTTHVKYGTYIVWPEVVTIGKETASISVNTEGNLTATGLAQHSGVSARQINLMLAELGWIKHDESGWKVTSAGIRSGGEQRCSSVNGRSWVCWPASVLDQPVVRFSLKEIKADLTHAIGLDLEADDPINHYRAEFPAKLRCADSHLVRSKTELLVDNWLYLAGVNHAYERRLPIDENIYGEFYLPAGNVYLEYLGHSGDNRYHQSKLEKLDVYRKYELDVITLDDDQVRQLDVYLPKQLLKYGIRIY